MTRAHKAVLLAAICLFLGGVFAREIVQRRLPDGPPPTEEEMAAITHTVDIYSNVFTIDQKFRSMMGPKSVVDGALTEANPPELLWVTGYRAVMMDAAGEEQRPQEFMCHANLNIDMQAHRKRFKWKKNASRRLFTLSQGQYEVHFPPGFGIPIGSDEEISVEMQALNLNEEGEPFQVRHKVTVEYVRDAELTKPMRPLFMKAATGLVSLGDSKAHYNVPDPDPSEHGEGCMVGERAAGNVRTDKLGNEFSGHWVVKPGREENHTLVTQWMKIPFDTTVHYVAAHVHPFAESISLRDLTTGETVFRSKAHNFEDRVGLERVEHYSSVEGFEVFADHEYEVVSVYNNTSGQEQDSMAVLFMYALDQEFSVPSSLAGS